MNTALGAHASSVPLSVSNTPHAGCVRSQARNVRVFRGEILLVAAGLLWVHRWFHFAQFTQTKILFELMRIMDMNVACAPEPKQVDSHQKRKQSTRTSRTTRRSWPWLILLAILRRGGALL